MCRDLHQQIIQVVQHQSAGTQYTRNTDSTITSNYINDVGPGDNGTVTGFVNAVGVGTITLDTGTNNGTNGALVRSDNKDASNQQEIQVYCRVLSSI